MISNNRQKLSNHWNYRKHKEDAPTLVNLPHANHLLPYNYFNEKDYQFISYYDKNLSLQKGKRYFISFDGVMTAFTLYANGENLGEYKGGYIPHDIELTTLVTDSEAISLTAVVDSTERDDIAPFGNVIDYLTFGGIYRDVWLYSFDNIFIENTYMKYKVLSHDGKTGTALFTPVIYLDSAEEQKDVTLLIQLNNTRITHSCTVCKGKQKIEFPSFTLEGLQLWSLETPHMYNCHITLESESSSDEADISIGIRDLQIETNGVYLNGTKIKLFGLNRHQSFPYVGYAMPKRVQEQDAIILKEELGLNTVRTSHYPQSSYFLNKCDELGLLVLEEIPGWQFISSKEEWREGTLNNVEGMIKRDWNHPSIITWGVRINESWDDHDLFSKTNALARELDSDRLTSGIRCMENSEILEDIYTMNDFAHEGEEIVLRPRTQCTGGREMPYLVTEFGGHIFPTKRFDQEQRIVEHALRHGRVQSTAAEKEEYLGAIGWCAFDYNTHFDFGSGDRICYHGVMDMFRIPKFAAAMYKSQKNPECGYVLTPLTLWTRGERDKAMISPIHVCTNCDTIELIMNGKSIATYERNPENTDPRMQYLNYPPFMLHLSGGEWGDRWSDTEFVGYAGGTEVIRTHFSADPYYHDLSVIPDGRELFADEYDAVRIEIKAVDQSGNILPFINDAITIETEGDIEVIGPKHTALIGGCIGVWIRTKVNAAKGCTRVTVESGSGLHKEINLQLI